MKTEDILTKKELIYLLVISLLSFFTLYIITPARDLSTINIISLASSVLSLCGFYVALKQIYSIKQIALNTEQAINEKIKGFNKVVFLSELSSKISLVSEIKGHLRDSDFKICVLRMEDFKKILAALSSTGDLLDLNLTKRELTAIIRNYTMDMSSLEKKIQNNEYHIEISAIINNLETLSMYLQNVEVQIKHT